MLDKTLRSSSTARTLYPVPAACLQGSLAEMLFWDALFYLLSAQGKGNRYGHRFVETNYADLQELADLSTKSLRKMIDMGMQFEEPYRVWEDEGIRPFSHLLTLKQYRKRLELDKIILKPVSYMENGWAWAVAQPYPDTSKKSRLPLAVLNVLFRRPHGQTTTFHEIVTRCRNKKKPPDAAEVEKAVAHLLNLGLINKANSRQFRLVRERFNADGRQAWKQLQPPEASAKYAHLIEWANKIDPQRAKLAHEIVNLGHFDFHNHFKEIFYDLASVQHDLELDWLRYVVKRKRGYHLSSKQRWRSVWTSYERKLHKEQFGSASKKVQFDLGQKGSKQAELSLNQHYPELLRWGKLVIWVNDARYQFCRLQRVETVRVTLERKGNLVCQHLLRCEDEVVRCDLTQELRSTQNPTYHLHVEAERPLRQFTITARLEAEYLPQRKE